MITCPICQKKFDANLPSPTKPFCSERCRNVDLSRWLNEDYGVPWDANPDEWSEEGEADGQPGAHGQNGGQPLSN